LRISNITVIRKLEKELLLVEGTRSIPNPHSRSYSVYLMIDVVVVTGVGLDATSNLPILLIARTIQNVDMSTDRTRVSTINSTGTNVTSESPIFISHIEVDLDSLPELTNLL
jgi:hypothetical protein